MWNDNLLIEHPPAAEKSGTETAKAERRPYSARHLMSACFDGENLPEPETYAEVQCHDISTSGISFYWPKRPDFDQVVFFFNGQGTNSLIAADVRGYQPSELHGRATFLVDSRFTSRLLKDLRTGGGGLPDAREAESESIGPPLSEEHTPYHATGEVHSSYQSVRERLTRMPLDRDSILIVDDDVTVLRFLTAILQSAFRNRVTLIPFQSPDDARNYLYEHTVDILIADFCSSTTDGMTLLLAARDGNPWCQSFLLATRANVDMLLGTIEAGATDILQKPLKTSTVVEIVKNAVHRSHRWKKLLAGAIEAEAGTAATAV